MTSKSTKTAVICRICLLGTKRKYLSLFESFKEYTPAYHINSITNLNINDEDSLPDTICTTCLLDLEKAINFKLKCESSDAYLKQTLDEINTDECLAKLEESDRKTCDVKIEKSDDCSNYEADYLEEDICDDEELTLNPVKDDTINKSEYELSLVPVDDNNVKIDVPVNSPVICHDCGGVFKSKCKLRVHWKKEHKQKNFDCDLCYARFRGIHALKRHKLVSRERCNLLKTVIIAGVGKSRIFTCPTCKYDTKNVYNMTQHLLIHNGEKKFKCSMCDKSFAQHAGLASHLETHNLIKKIVTCDICGRVFYSQAKFKKHMNLKHSSQQFECDYCHKTFNYRSLLVDHIKRHSGIKQYSCEYCAKQFALLSGLITHKRNVHSNNRYVKPIDCPICPYKAMNPSAMSSHITKHESGQLSCDLCGTFHESELMLWFHKICHLPRHSIARRTCPICDHLYGKFKLMKNHVRRCHFLKKIKTFDAEDVVSKIKCAIASENTTNYRKKQKEDFIM